MRIPVLFLILFFCSSVAFSQNCGATSCAYFGRLSDAEYSKKLNAVSAIFYGEIISQSEPVFPKKGFPYRVLKVKVLRVWKGVESNEVEVEFHYYDRDCMEVGESGKLMFYAAFTKSHTNLMTYWCDKYSFDEKKTKTILGDGKLIKITEQK